MALEQFSNFGTTTLNGAINNSVTSVTVTDASVFPSSPNFRIKIEDELLLVTNMASNVLTVTRGVESTTAVSHVDLTSVVGMLLTTQSIANFRSDTIKSDLAVNRDANNLAGRLFIPSDGSGVYDYNNGSQWNPILNHQANNQTIPLLNNFPTLFNTGTFTSVQNGDCFVLGADANGIAINTQSANSVLKSISLPVTITAQIRASYHPKLTGGATNSPIANGYLALRQSTFSPSSSDSILFGWTAHFFEGQGELLIAGAGSSGGAIGRNLGASTQYIQVATFWPEKPTWFQIVQPASGTRLYKVSVDGVNWITLFSEAFNSFILPDQAGFAVNANADNGSQAYLNVSSYKET